LVSAALSLIVATTAAAQTPTYTFTPIDVPQAREVHLTGINNAGQIIGYYEDGAYHGLFYSDGSSFTTIDVAGPGPDTFDMLPENWTAASWKILV
jgi:probable HAF family extracellular repeat protein